MDLKNSSTGLAIGALGAAVAGMAISSPGSWGLAASWGCAAAGLGLLKAAWSVDQQARLSDQVAEDYFARGETIARQPRSSLLRRGAALTLAATVSLLLSCAVSLGCFSWGLGWGLLAITPLTVLAYGVIKSASNMGGDHE